ncbi:MAG: ATP-binding protein [Myxococcales bacterium]|nr:ATP-binding protein [Myxococcales bacterium]
MIRNPARAEDQSIDESGEAPGLHRTERRGERDDASLGPREALLSESSLHDQRIHLAGRMVGEIAHDFNNLLATMVTYTTLVLETLPARDPRSEDLREVIRTARTAGFLSHRLLSFFHKRPVESVLLDVGEELRVQARLLQRLLGSRVQVVVIPFEERAHIRIDPGQFEQLLMNLSVNARDAMPSGGRLTLRVETTELHGATGEGWVILTVSDTGCGIDEATQKRLFDPFYSTKRGRGAGLGLATCRAIVEQAGGTISVRSACDEGSVFRIELPRHPSPAPAPVRAERGAVDCEIEPGVVIVVEDQAELLSATSRSLEHLGLSVLQARSAEEALIVASEARDPVRLVISDVILPGLSGVELIERLRLRLGPVAAMLVSGSTEEHGSRRLEAEGPTRFLGKPFTASELRAAAVALLESRRDSARPLAWKDGEVRRDAR